MSITSIVIDTNEISTAPWIWDAVDHPSKGQSNIVGDLWVATDTGEMIIFERKSPNDYLASIADGRRTNQAVEMLEQSQWSYLIITNSFHGLPNGYLEYYSETKGWVQTKWEFAAVWGSILSLQDLGIGIIFCNGKDDYWPCIKRIVKRSRGDLSIYPRRQSNVVSPQENVLLALPGIGSKKALEYLSLFQGNLALALTALTAEHDGKMNHIPGYGQKSRDNVVSFLGGKLEYKTDGN